MTKQQHEAVKLFTRHERRLERLYLDDYYRPVKRRARLRRWLKHTRMVKDLLITGDVSPNKLKRVLVALRNYDNSETRM